MNDIFGYQLFLYVFNKLFKYSFKVFKFNFFVTVLRTIERHNLTGQVKNSDEWLEKLYQDFKTNKYFVPSTVSCELIEFII